MDGESVLTNNILFQISILILLTAVNAFFASAEMAIVSLNKNRMKMLANEGNKKAGILCKLIEDPNNFLSTIQVGITLAGFFASASAATGISQDLGRVLSDIGIPYGNEIAFAGVTIILSYFTLVFGELVPKRIALKKSEKIAMLCLKPILIISKIVLPFVKILSMSTYLIVKFLGLDNEEDEQKVTKEEIKSLLEEGEEYGAINESEKEMIEGIFEINDKRTEKIMIPRTEVYCIDIEDDLDLYLDELLKTKFSRIPVYEDSIDNIIGILYMKDFIIEAREKGFDNINIREILQKPYFVHEGKKIHSLLKSMQASKMHMAIVIDEYGGFSGIVTIKDLIEEITGELNDCDDNDDEEIIQIDSKTFLVDGITPLDEINDKLQLELECKDVDTLSGFLINLIGKIPSEKDDMNIKYKNINFKIDKFNEKRIERIFINILDSNNKESI
ncbi:MAG: HlyC/CorC family transporter [Clostridium butyricum]|nr:HlyC/CorC family transporter [Clostridium butyricum]